MWNLVEWACANTEQRMSARTEENAISCIPLTTTRFAQISPLSTPAVLSFISITQTPVCARPSAMACWMGAGPRYRGNSDGCTFRRREGGKRCSNVSGMMRPKEAVMSTAFGSSRCWSKGGGGWNREIVLPCRMNEIWSMTYLPFPKRRSLWRDEMHG